MRSVLPVMLMLLGAAMQAAGARFNSHDKAFSLDVSTRWQAWPKWEPLSRAPALTMGLRDGSPRPGPSPILDALCPNPRLMITGLRPGSWRETLLGELCGRRNPRSWGPAALTIKDLALERKAGGLREIALAELCGAREPLLFDWSGIRFLFRRPWKLYLRSRLRRVSLRGDLAPAFHWSCSRREEWSAKWAEDGLALLYFSYGGRNYRASYPPSWHAEAMRALTSIGPFAEDAPWPMARDLGYRPGHVTLHFNMGVSRSRQQAFLVRLRGLGFKTIKFHYPGAVWLATPGDMDPYDAEERIMQLDSEAGPGAGVVGFVSRDLLIGPGAP